MLQIHAVVLCGVVFTGRRVHAGVSTHSACNAKWSCCYALHVCLYPYANSRALPIWQLSGVSRSSSVSSEAGAVVCTVHTLSE